MSNRQTPKSTSKKLYGIPKDIGPIEVVIEPPKNYQIIELNKNEPNNAQDARPIASDGTVAWYHSLGETEKQVKGLQLHETLSHPPFVVLSMNDSSFLLFELTLTASPDGDLYSIGVTRLTDSETRRLAPCSIQVDFSPTPEGGVVYVDLKFAIAVCYGFFEFNRMSSLPTATKNGYSPLVSQRLFALALFVSVVRQRLPVNESLIKGITTGVPAVDKFCSEVLSREQVGQLLWVDTIVEEVHEAVNQGIREAAVDRLKSAVFLTNLPESSVNDKDETKLNIAKLLVAWLEFMADKGEPPASRLWDEEWGRNWSPEWKRNWVEKWNLERRTLLAHPFINGDQFVHKLPSTSVLSGSASGRAMIEAAWAASIIPADHLPVIEIPATGQPKDASKIQVDCKGKPLSLGSLNFPIQEVEEAIPPITPSKGKSYILLFRLDDEQTPLLSSQAADARDWFDFWYTIRRPDLKRQGKWLPTWEAASNMAWVLGWGDCPEKKAGPSTLRSGARGEIQPQDTHPYPDPGAGLSIPDLHDLYELTRHFLGLDNRSQTEVAILDGGTTKLNLQKLSEAAWIVAYNSDSEMDAYMEEQGEEMFELLKMEIERGASTRRLAVLTKDQCIRVFKDTLKQTWQRCWERSWEKIMNDTSEKLNKWKHTTRNKIKSTALVSNTRIANLESDSHKHVEGGISEEENLWSIRSAFKASALLHRVLEHSVPICYEGAMTIRFFPDRPFDFSTPNPGSKLKGITKAIHQDGERLLTHKELQDRIKKLTHHRNRVPKFPSGRTPIQEMEFIWKTANSVDAKPEFMGSKDTIQSRPWQKVQMKTLPQRKYKLTFARYMWQKTLKDLNTTKNVFSRPTTVQSTDPTPVSENTQVRE